MNTLAKVPQVHFIYIGNPLQPAESRIDIMKDHDALMTLDQYLGPLEGEWAVSVSGRIVSQEEWSLTYVHERDCVVICPIIAGGGQGQNQGSGKMILRMVAIIALTVVSAGAGAAYGAAAGAALGVSAAAGTALVSAGIMLAGSMAINALLPPASAKVAGSGSDYANSPTYGIDGPKNNSTRNIPVPVGYGTYWFAGNFIQSYVDNMGDDQYLNLLINAGEGPIKGISDIQINDQPISSFTNVQTWVRTGVENQPMIPYFDDIITPVNRSVTLQAGNYMLHSVTDSVDRLRVDIVLPAGVYTTDDDTGEFESFTAQFSIEITEEGSSNWRPFVEGAGSPNIGVRANQMSAIRRSYYSATLDRSKRYRIRATHLQSTDQTNTSNGVVLTDVNSIVFDDLNYKHTALLGLRIKLSDQLNGIPRVVFKMEGREVPVYNPLTGAYENTFTNNPAWITLDMLMNKRYGGGVSASRIKMGYFRQWATFCANNNLTFDGVIDQRTNLWDAIVPVAKLGRGQVIRAGTRFQVAMVRQQKPVQMFTGASIRKGSFSLDWLAADERANEVNVTYFDINDLGKQKSVIVPNTAARERGEEPRPTDLTLYGCTTVQQATREGTLAMNMQNLLQTISFDVPLESIVCTLGDVVSIQHDVANWGEGGLVEEGSTRSLIKVDRIPTMELGGQYVVKVRHDSIVQGVFDVEEVIGNIVIPGFGFNITNYDRFRRVVVPGTGQDYQVEEAIIDQYGRHGLRLDRTAGITVGTTIQLVDTNVIETVLVSSVNAENMTITTSSQLKAIPRAGSPWGLGLNESTTKSMTVTSISGKGDVWRTLGGIEYADASYSDTVTDYKPEPTQTRPIIRNVDFGGFKEKRYLVGAAYTSDVEFTWSSSDIAYAYAEIHVSLDDEPYKFLDGNSGIYTVKNIPSGKIKVKLVPVTIEGFKPNFLSVTEHEYVVVGGVPRNPDPPLNFQIGVITDDLIELKWGDLNAWSAAQNIYRYEIWHAPYQNARLEDAQLLAITGNNHYPHVGLTKLSWHTYWLRTTNTQANNVKSTFVPSGETGLVAQVKDNDPNGLIGLTDLDQDLREAIDAPKKLEDIAAVISNALTKLEDTTDEQKQEVYDREQEVEGVRAYVNEQVMAVVEDGEATALRVSQLEASVSPAVLAKINELSQVITNADSSLAQQILLMQAKFTEDINAAIIVEQEARSSADSATALKIETLTTTVGENTTSLQVVSRVVDGLSASYAIRIDVNGVISGFGLATGAGGTSEFVISATRFKVVAPGQPGSAAVPIFQVDTATGRVLLRNAVVGDLQSDNYVSGVSGWCIKK